MKKFILPISLALFFFTLVPSVVVAQSATTSSADGETYSSQRSGNSVVITRGDGKTLFTGTISGSAVTGTQYLHAPACPNLKKEVPASGTVSADGGSITVKYTAPLYDIDGCYDLERTKNYTTSYTIRESTSTVTQQPKKPAEQGEAAKNNIPFSFFGINPYETWLRLVAISGLPEAIRFIQPPSSLTFDDIEENDDEYFDNFAKKHAKLDKEKLAKNFKKSVEAWKDSRWWQSYLDRYAKDAVDKNSEYEIKIPSTFESDSAIIQVRPSDGSLKAGKFEFRDRPYLKNGEAEVIVEPGDKEDPFKFSTPNADIFVIGTHFLVSYDQERGKTGVLVYEGKVKVQPLGSDKSVTITPDDKPAIVGYKFSLVRAIIVTAVLIGVIGGIIVILSKKFTSKSRFKKKR